MYALSLKVRFLLVNSVDWTGGETLKWMITSIGWSPSPTSTSCHVMYEDCS